MARPKIRSRARDASGCTSTDDGRRHSSNSSDSTPTTKLPRSARIIGWLIIVAVVIGIILWLQAVDEDLRRTLIAECQQAGRGDCGFEQRSARRNPSHTANGFFPRDGIVGYSRWTPVLKQFATAGGGLVIGKRLLSRRPVAK